MRERNAAHDLSGIDAKRLTARAIKVALRGLDQQVAAVKRRLAGSAEAPTSSRRELDQQAQQFQQTRATLCEWLAAAEKREGAATGTASACCAGTSG